MRIIAITLGLMLLAGCQAVQVAGTANDPNPRPGEKHTYRLCTDNAAGPEGKRILAMTRVMLAQRGYYETPDAKVLLTVTCSRSKPMPGETTTLESADPMDAAGPFLLGPFPGDDADSGYTWNEPSYETPVPEAIFIYTKTLGLHASPAGNPKAVLWMVQARIADQSSSLMQAVPYLLAAAGEELDKNTGGWHTKYISRHDNAVNAIQNTPPVGK